MSKATDSSGDDPFHPDHTYDAHLRLFDRQVIARDDELVGKVDDLELTGRADGPPEVTAILMGPGPWAGRTPGAVGRYVRAMWTRLHPDPDPRPRRIPLGSVQAITSAIKLSIAREDVIEGGAEQWARRHMIAKLPGAGHDPE
jgi:hypothetical protein